jgi:predicted amidohydrolase YtcJ
MALESFGKLQDPTTNRKLRHRIEHASVLKPEHFSRIKELGVIASVQPHFVVSDFWVEQRLGQDRASLTYAYGSLLKAGVRVVGGSDCPVEPLAPLLGIEAAVNRVGDEAVGVEDAIAFFTRNASYASFDEDEKGTITAGKLADLVILEKDPRKVPPSMISKIQVVKTMVGGRIVHPLSSNP